MRQATLDLLRRAAGTSQRYAVHDRCYLKALDASLGWRGASIIRLPGVGGLKPPLVS